MVRNYVKKRDRNKTVEELEQGRLLDKLESNLDDSRNSVEELRMALHDIIMENMGDSTISNPGPINELLKSYNDLTKNQGDIDGALLKIVDQRTKMRKLDSDGSDSNNFTFSNLKD